MELQYASITQVRQGKGGREVVIEDDVMDVVRQIKEISLALSVHWNDDGEYFQIKERCADGKDRLVLTTQELDQRLLAHLRKIGSPGWNAGREMERHEDAREKALDHAFHEKVGPIGERAAWAVRKDLEAQNRIFLPRGVRL